MLQPTKAYVKRLIELAEDLLEQARETLTPITDNNVNLFSEINYLVGYIQGLKEKKDKKT